MPKCSYKIGVTLFREIFYYAATVLTPPVVLTDSPYHYENFLRQISLGSIKCSKCSLEWIWKKIPPSPCDKAEAQLCKLMLNCKARERWCKLAICAGDIKMPRGLWKQERQYVLMTLHVTAWETNFVI